MVTRNLGENFKVVLSTKKTLFGASATDFKVAYADINNLSAKTSVTGGVTEAVATVATPHTATTTASASFGDRKLTVSNTSTLVAGDVIQYATGKYAYVQSIVGSTVYLNTPLRANVASGSTLTQVGNLGEYTTSTISIPTAGEYIVSIESSLHGVLVEQRVKVVDTTATTSVDVNAPVATVAVAY